MIAEGTLEFSRLDGRRTDAGTFESLLRPQNLVAEQAQLPAPATGRYSSAPAWVRPIPEK
jgi:hypothetical protein